MKFSKRVLALTLAALMILPFCITANAYATNTLRSSSSVNGATYYNYSVYGSVSGKTADVDVIKFNVNDGIIPMAYSTAAGKASVLSTHVQAAIDEGYEVIGAINASFFDMSTSDPCGALISDGKLVFDHSEKNDTVITAFDANGYPTLLGDATLDYSLTLGGNTISTKAIGMVNKDYTTCNMVDATISTRYHYYDSDMGNLANSAQTGYEILCEKINGTEISVGKTLQGRVISVTSGYYGKTTVTNKNQFVLFVKSNGTYVNYATSLYSGASVSLTVTATNNWSNEVLSRCTSAISSTYWLVQNGNDLTDTQTSIIHNTSTVHRAWTAFGWDDNGNYYFFASQENKLSLKDVADSMISMGCKNVLRLDGGGSTTMWVNGKGLVENAGSRPLVDALLIVKLRGAENNLASGRNYKISVTNDPIIDTTWNNDYSANLTDGVAARAFSGNDGSWFAFSPSKNVVDGIGSVTVDFDTLCDINELRISLVNQSDWGVNAPNSVKAYGSVDGNSYVYIGDMPIQHGDGTSYWSELPVNVRYGSIRFEFSLNGSWAMVNEIEVHGTQTALPYPYSGTKNNLATGKDYVISVTNDPIIDTTWNNDYSANLTDGIASTNFDASNGSWFAFYTDKNVVNGIGSVTIDFEKICNVNQLRVNLVNQTDWGVNAPSTIKVYGSSDGKTYNLIGNMPINSSLNGTSYWSETNVNASVGSVRFEFELNGYWALVNEIEIHGTQTNTDYHVCAYDGTGWKSNDTSHWQQCSCGEKLNLSTHNFSGWQTVTSPGCVTDGQEKRQCSVCSYVETRVLNATGHKYTSVVTKPTCTAQGYTTYTCSCGDNYVGDYVNALGHTYTLAVTNPTCTAQGYTTYTCKCGYSYTDDYINPTGHTLGKWTEVTPNTCTTDGLERRDCANCDYFEEQTIKSTGHTYTLVVTNPTCEDKGYTTYTCKCGYSYVGNYINANGHAYGNWYTVDNPTCTVTGLERRDCNNCNHYETNVLPTISHDYQTIVTDPTCTERGYTTYICKCGSNYKGNYKNALGHTYSSVVTEPTCTEPGYTTYTCHCGDSYMDDYVDANGHKYTVVVTKPSCEEGGYTTYTCHCGYSYVGDNVSAKGHTMGAFAVVKAATCTEKGLERSDCNDCNYYEERTIDAFGHKYTIVVTEPTCEEDGYTTYTCHCGYSYVGDNVSAKGHTMGELVTQLPTCTENGYERQDCKDCDYFIQTVLTASGHKYTTVTTPPSCKEYGSVIYTCHCGESYVEYIEMLEHDMDNWYTVEFPDCVNDGVKRSDCKLCDYYEEETIDALGHEYTSVVTAPTCEEKGYTTYTCHCGDSYIDDYVNANGHDFGDWYVSVPATADAVGEERQDCKNCDHFKTQTIPALGHNYVPTVTPPTCEEDGYTTYNCDCCGGSYVQDYVSATGHDFGEWITMQEPTCTTEGFKCRGCKNCDYFDEELIEEKGHAMGDWYNVTPKTCTVDGLDRRDCKDCNYYEENVLTAEGHKYTPAVTDPTCTERGYTTYTCHCGDSYIDDYVSANGHDMGDWYNVTPKTCTVDGLDRRDCKNCNYYEENVLTAEGHKYTPAVTDPTCTERGYTTYTCSCGDSYIDDYINANGHTLGGVYTVTYPGCETEGLDRKDCENCDYFEEYSTSPNGHNMGDWYNVTPKTCTVDGLDRRDCKNCKYYEENVLTAEGHKYTSTVTAPTCETRGYTTYVCHCGHSYIGNYVAASGHNYDEVITAPTCEKQGYTTYTCSCGDSYIDDYVNANGHDMGDWYNVTPKTCMVDGLDRRDCKNCNHYEENVLTAEGHKYTPAVTAPTCTERGYTTYTCSCGDSYIDDYVNANGHDMGDWYNVTPKTCTVDGLDRRDCKDCNYYEENVLTAEGHKYTPVVTAPTCEEQGYTTYTCHCGHSYIGNYVAASGHNYDAVITAPTCENKGYTTYTCHCGNSYSDNVVSELGHLFTDYQSDNNATCSANGTKTATCDRDGCNKTSVLEDENTKLPHRDGKWVVTTPAGLDTEGKKEYQCVDCEEVIDEITIPAEHKAASDKLYYDDYNHWQQCGCGEKLNVTPHTKGDWTEIQAPKLHQDGIEAKCCIDCEKVLETQSIPALHSSPDGKWNGSKTNHWQECSCGIVINAGDHDQGEWITVSVVGLDVDGVRERRCTVCGYVLESEITPAIHTPKSEKLHWDKTGHWKECSCGEKIGFEKHQGEWQETAVGETEKKVCIVCGYVIETREPTNFVLGDVNRSGAIDMMDYVLLKRNYFGTFVFDDYQRAVGDVNKSGGIDMMDYVLLKRAYFGTFKLQ